MADTTKLRTSYALLKLATRHAARAASRRDHGVLVEARRSLSVSLESFFASTEDAPHDNLVVREYLRNGRTAVSDAQDVLEMLDEAIVVCFRVRNLSVAAIESGYHRLFRAGRRSV